MKKNVVYVVLVLLFVAGGVVAFANWASEGGGVADLAEFAPLTQTAAAENPPAVGGVTVAAQTEQAALANVANLRREEDSFVSIVRSDVARAEDLTFDDISEMVREAVALAGGLEGIVNDGDTVILKPNLVTMRCNTLPGWTGRQLPPQVNGNSTDYRVTRVVAQMVRELNPSGRIYVMEGSIQNTAEVFVALNYTHEHIPEVDAFLPIETDSGAWQDRQSAGLVRVRSETALLHQYYYYNRRIYEADVVINLPTLKNHWDTVTTGSIKNIGIGNTPANIYGDAPNDTHRLRYIRHNHRDVHRWIVDYYLLRPADFIVMDALQGLSHGPTPSFAMSGIRDIADAQMNMRTVLASSDSLAIDIVQANIMNWDFESVIYLEYMIDMGLGGQGNTANIVVYGVKVDEIRTDFDGVTPVTAGRRLTQRTPPEISITSAYFNGQNALRMQLALSDNTDKLDIYIDGRYVTSVSENMRDFTLYGVSGGNITVYAFDIHMHHNTASVTVEAPTGLTPLTPTLPPINAPAPREVTLAVGVPIYIDGEYYGTPRMEDGRVIVPVRFLMEEFGADVVWNSADRTVTIIMP